MNTVFVYFSNHFDLVWRRCWDRAYDHAGGRYASYRRIEELCLLRNLALAERGQGAYVLEQALSLRAFLERHPRAAARLRRLHRRGLFEMLGAGEAIIDVNQCACETMCRNLASGLVYVRSVLGASPLLANHGDGFGSSAQFPQVIRACGLRGIWGLSYSVPDNRYWRGLDGSTVLVWHGAPGRGYFFDHCYHEPCRVCHGRTQAACRACEGTGLDLPQNHYPPFVPVATDAFAEGLALYNVCSEEMLPPANFAAHWPEWERATPGVRYRWGTPRRVRRLWARSAAQADRPPPSEVASRLENNPVQTGCYVSRIRIKQEARRCEAALYGWETALALTCPAALAPARWEWLFRELPLFFFHDAVTGTHQDEAYAELLERMASQRTGVERGAGAALRAACGPRVAVPAAAKAGARVAVFNPNADTRPVRVPLAPCDWRTVPALVAVAADGTRWPVVPDLQPAGPPAPGHAARLVPAVGPAARTRPDAMPVHIEVAGLPALAWSNLRLETATPPVPLAGCELRNPHVRVTLGDHGVSAVTVGGTTAAAGGGCRTVGELFLEEDEGDPWGTRRPASWRRGLAEFTHRLGAVRGDGYSEACYAGRYEPNLRFGREQDPNVFSLEWYVTVRLLDSGYRVDFQYEVFWKSVNRRLRVGFPVGAAGDTGWYSIPGGWLERPRYEQTETCLWSPNGDWPALHFAAASPAAHGRGWAVVNYGTPSARIEDGTILMSVLRSPGFGHCLERYAQSYPMPTSGTRDGGWHLFRFSLLPHDGADGMPGLAATAAALNAAPPACVLPRRAALPGPVPFSLEGDGVQMVAAKRPFRGAGPAGRRVLRLLNLRSAPNEVRLRAAAGWRLRVAETRLTEDGARPLPTRGGLSVLRFRPFEVKTLRIDPLRT